MADENPAESLPAQPTDEWLDLTQAAAEYGIRRDTLIRRVADGKFTEGAFRKVPFGSKGKYQVLRSAMAAQPNVDGSAKRTYVRKARTSEPTGLAPLTDISSHVLYAAGYLTAWLDLYARGQGIGAVELVGGVIGVLKGGAK